SVCGFFAALWFVKYYFLNFFSLNNKQITIWKVDYYFVSRTPSRFISKLRKSLKEDSSIKIINIHGAVYKFEVTE
ncbi:MAG: helix-turn-helix domain-containing protein, partial [Flavobacteriales bacterium]